MDSYPIKWAGGVITQARDVLIRIPLDVGNKNQTKFKSAELSALTICQDRTQRNIAQYTVGSSRRMKIGSRHPDRSCIMHSL